MTRPTIIAMQDGAPSTQIHAIEEEAPNPAVPLPTYTGAATSTRPIVRAQEQDSDTLKWSPASQVLAIAEEPVETRPYVLILEHFNSFTQTDPDAYGLYVEPILPYIEPADTGQTDLSAYMQAYGMNRIASKGREVLAIAHDGTVWYTPISLASPGQQVVFPQVQATATVWATSVTSGGVDQFHAGKHPFLANAFSAPDLFASLQGLAVIGNQVWVLEGRAGRIYRFNFDGTVAAAPFIIPPTGNEILQVGSEVWILTGTPSIARYTMTGTFLGSIGLDPHNFGLGGMAIVGSQVWVVTDSQFAPDYNCFIVRFNFNGTSAGPNLSGNGMNFSQGLAVVGSEVWVVSALTDHFHTPHISRFTFSGAVAGPPIMGNGLFGPFAIAVVGSEVWVANEAANSISRFNFDGTVAGPIVDSSPFVPGSFSTITHILQTGLGYVPLPITRCYGVQTDGTTWWALVEYLKPANSLRTIQVLKCTGSPTVSSNWTFAYEVREIYRAPLTGPYFQAIGISGNGVTLSRDELGHWYRQTPTSGPTLLGAGTTLDTDLGITGDPTAPFAAQLKFDPLGGAYLGFDVMDSSGGLDFLGSVPAGAVSADTGGIWMLDTTGSLYYRPGPAGSYYISADQGAAPSALIHTLDRDADTLYILHGDFITSNLLYLATVKIADLLLYMSAFPAPQIWTGAVCTTAFEHVCLTSFTASGGPLDASTSQVATLIVRVDTDLSTTSWLLAILDEGNHVVDLTASGTMIIKQLSHSTAQGHTYRAVLTQDGTGTDVDAVSTPGLSVSWIVGGFIPPPTPFVALPPISMNSNAIGGFYDSFYAYGSPTK